MADQSSLEQATPVTDTGMGASSADAVDDHAAVSTTANTSASAGGSGGGVLQGTLLYRRNLSAKKMSMWKSSMRMYTVLDMTQQQQQQQASPSSNIPSGSGTMSGSLICYRFEGLSKREANAAYSPTELKTGDSVRYQGMSNVRTCLELPSYLPWTVRDVENDASAFMVEIPVKEGLACLRSQSEDKNDDEAEAEVPAVSYDDDDDDDDDDGAYDYADDEDDDGMYVFWGDGDEEEGDDVEDSTRTESTSGSEHINMDVVPNQVEVDLLQAAARRRPYIRYAFRCPTKRSEKALWLTAFQKVDRLATESRRKRSLFGTSALSSVSTIRQSNSRVRRGRGVDLARQSMNLDKDIISEGRNSFGGANDGLETSTTDDAIKEYRVRPNYNYPHRWMTHEELIEEMLGPSAEIHDLRLPPAIAPRQEIGLLRVEVLQCLGLPRPKGKTTSVNPNAVVYLVCGAYAFATDVIPQCTDPMWLKGMRRACQIPINHGYARLFLGVFHDDGTKSPKDLFIGRAVVEVPRLRPGATYDVTLPLRQSASVYSRRKRGAVRLRFSLDISDEKQLVLSYFPSKRNRAAGQIGTTTVACADPKSFRNVALTVNGIHLPGKFSTDHFMAIIREFKFVQKVICRLLVKFIEDLVVWRYPVKSAFVFVAWMHSLYVNSATMIPVYTVSFIFLQLVANYARCIVAGAEFRPATWEEIFGSLTGSGGNVSGDDDADSRRNGGKIHSLIGISDKYDPVGQSIFTLLGFMGKKDEYFVGGVDTFALDEFPYASLAGYPKLSVDEAVVKGPVNQTALELRSNTDGCNEDEDDNGFGLMDDTQTSNNLIDLAAEEYQPRIYFKKRIPQQNIDLKVKGDGKSIADELMEIEEKIQKATQYAFRDNAYLITDPSHPPFGKRSRDSDGYNVERDLNKLLGTGQFSQWNPIVSKYSVQFEPIIRICVVFLSFYRSIYNIFTWRDPYLSFWFSLVCLAATFVMVLFPWRPCLFVLGVVALGPQNWLLRLFRELVWSSDDSNRPGRFLRAFRELLKSSDDDDDGSDDTADGKNRSAQNEVVSEPQPVFFAHAPASKPLLERTDTVGAQHVVIPYSPLLSQRFYDWPPDKKYARVTTATLKELPLRSTSEKAITKASIMPSAPSPKETPRRQEGGESTQGENKKEFPLNSPPRPGSTPRLPSTSTPRLSTTSSIESSTRNGGGRIVLSLQGSPSKDDDEGEPRNEQSDASGTQSLKSDSPSAASSIATTSATSSFLARKAKGTLTAQASRSVGGLSKSIAKKGQGLASSLKKSVNFNDDISMLSTTSNTSTGKGKMGRLIKPAKLPTNFIKSKKDQRIGGEISVPEEVSDEDWLKMPGPHVEAKEGAEISQVETGTNDDGGLVQQDALEEATANYGTANVGSSVDSHAAETEDGDMKEKAQEKFAVSTPVESASVEDKGPATESLDRYSSEPPPVADEITGTNHILDAKVSEETDAIESEVNVQPNVEAPINATVVDESERDEWFSADIVDKASNGDSSASEAVAILSEQKRKEKATVLDQNVESDLPSTSLDGAAQSPSNEAAAFLETLMEVKLELATARTENDHYRAKLKETEEERDYYKNKYNECMEGKDAQTPNWLANGEAEGSPPPAPPSRQQNQFGFKMNMTSMSSPFRKQPPLK